MANFSLLAKLGLDSKAFQTGIKGAQGRAGSFASSMKKLFAAATGGSLLIAAKRAIDLGSRISDLSVQLNIGAESLQALQFAAQEAGVKSQTLERALRNVQLRTQEAIKGNKSYAEAFEQLGINVAEFAGMNTEQKFEAIARAQANATDKQMAFANVARILGERAGPELNEVLMKLANEGLSAFEKAARDAGQVLDASTIKSLDKASDTLSAFGKSITVLAAKAIEPILPILIKFTDFVSRNSEEVFRGVKNIIAFALGFKSAKTIIPVVTKLVGLFSLAARGAAGATFALNAAIITLKNTLRGLAAATGVGILFVALSVGAEKLTMKLLGTKKETDELKKSMDSLDEQTNEFAESLDSQIALMDKAAKATEKYTKTLDDQRKVDKIVKNAQKERAQNQQDLIDKQRESFIATKELQALELRAAGKNAQAEALEKQIELMEKAIQISGEYGISLEKAAALVRGIEENKLKEDEGGGDGGGNGGALGGISSLAAVGGGGRVGTLKPLDKANDIATNQLTVLKSIERNTQPQTPGGTIFK